MSRPTYALVKWIDKGRNNNKYTPDIPVEWIIGFEEKKFRAEELDPDESYVIEWRDSKQKPKGGWKVYDGIVIDVSTRKSHLEKRLEEIVGEKSPDRIVPKSKSPHKSFKDRENIEEIGKKSKGKTKKVINGNGLVRDENGKNSRGGKNEVDLDRAHCSKDDPENASFFSVSPVDKIRHVNRKLSFNHSRTNLFDGASTPLLPPKDTGKKRPTIKNDEIIAAKILKPINLEIISEAVQELKDLRRKVEEIQNRMEATNQSKNTPRSSSVNRSATNVLPQIEEKNYARPVSMDEVEIGRPGRCVIIDVDAWDAAMAKKSFTAMGTSLLLAAFDLKVLLQSNVRGGKSRIDNSGKRYKALDSRTLSAIHYTVKMVHPGQYNEAKLNIAINGKLSSLRSQARKAQLDSSDED